MLFGFGDYFPHHLCWFIFEKAKWSNDVERRVQKNIQNKAVQTKLNLFINKYMKWNISKHYECSTTVC